MNFIRQLETTTKLYACFAILLCAGAWLAIWLLMHLGQFSELAAHAAPKADAAGGAPELVRADFIALRAWTWTFLAADLALAAALARWLATKSHAPCIRQ